MSVFAFAGGALAQPSNDDCAAPIPLVNGTNPALTNGAGTTNGADPLFTCAPAVSDVWFSYTPSCSGTVVFAMCPAPGASGIDSVMEVYSGSCGSLVSVGCDDDGCGVIGGGSAVVLSGASPAVPLLVRVGSFSTPGTTGSFAIVVTCTGTLVDDWGDASGVTFARHLNALAGERLGATVTAEAFPSTPAWYGDAGDDGIVSVSNLFPTSTSGQIVVSARNPSATATSLCRMWVDRDNTVGWSPFADALPTQSATVGPTPVNFTFGPFTLNATTPPSPFVRVRLSSNAAGVQAASGTTGASGEVEDYVLAGTGGPTNTATAGGGGSDAGDAPLPYPPANSTFIFSERLGATVTADTSAPVGFGVTTGNAAWDDDSGDDGIVRIDGLAPGGSCTLTVTAVDPLGTFADNVDAWMDFDGDGVWDEVGEVFAPVGVNVGPTPVTVTLGPLAVPASVGSTVAARIKINYAAAANSLVGSEAAGTSFIFGEVEDYLLPVARGIGCNSGGGGPPSIWAEDPPREGLPFTWREAGLSPSVGTFMVVDSVNFLPAGIDVSIFAPGIIPPATCFLYAGLATLASIGASDPAGNLSVTVPVPGGTAGATLYLQSFQITPTLAIVMTPVLPLTILP